jgi:hypothetical protein
MTEQQYLDYNRALLAQFTLTFTTRTEQLPHDHPLRELAQSFAALQESGGDFYSEAPVLIARLFDTYPEFAPTFPRQLLWFLGGDCLHYMADDEIDQYQQLEELRMAAARRGDTFDFQEARAKLLNLQ